MLDEPYVLSFLLGFDGIGEIDNKDLFKSYYLTTLSYFQAWHIYFLMV